MPNSREKGSLDSDANALEWESKTSIRPAEYGFEREVFKEPRGVPYAEH